MKNLLHFSTPSCVYSQQPTLRTEKTKMSQLMWKPASEIMMTHRCRKDGKNRIKECQHAKLQLGVFLQRSAASEVRGNWKRVLMTATRNRQQQTVLRLSHTPYMAQGRAGGSLQNFVFQDLISNDFCCSSCSDTLGCRELVVHGNEASVLLVPAH